MVVHSCNSSTWEAEMGRLPVSGQLGLHRKGKRRGKLGNRKEKEGVKGKERIQQG
jgi:hypothetical protein